MYKYPSKSIYHQGNDRPVPDSLFEANSWLDGIYTRKRLLQRLTRVAEYLYEYYDTYTSYADPSDMSLIPGGCSSFKMGDKMGRNLDWYYNDQVDFIINCSRPGCRKSMGIASHPKITKSSLKAGEYIKYFEVLPWYTQDGINEDGLYASINVVPDDIPGGLTDYTPDGYEDSIDVLQIVRYILDYCTSVEDACDKLSRIQIRYNRAVAEKGYGIHAMVADKNSCVVLEVVNGELKIIESNKSTNFWLYGTTLNDESGRVYTNADVPDNLPTRDNGITPLGSGLERWNIIAGYDGADPRELLNMLAYTHTYTNTSDIWYSELVYAPRNVTVDTPVDSEEMQYMLDVVHSQYESRSRDNPVTWHTTHSSVYDLKSLTLSIVSQEDSSNEFEYALIGGKRYRATKIGDKIWLSENLDLKQTVEDAYSFSTYRPGFEDLYKRYYTWDATENLVLPDGWRLPSKEDYEELIFAAGDDVSALKADHGWRGSDGTDSLKFSALPGCRYFSRGWVDLLCADFWTSTEGTSSGMYYHVILNADNTHEIPQFPHAAALLPIRLVHDAIPELPPYTLRFRANRAVTTSDFDKPVTLRTINHTSHIYDLYYNNADWSTMFAGKTWLVDVLDANLDGVTNVGGFFSAASNLETLKISSAADLTSLGGFFYGLSKLVSATLKGFISVQDFGSLFYSFASLQQAVIEFGPSCKFIPTLFGNCQKLEKVIIYGDTSGITNMSGMCNNCTSLTYVSTFNTINVTNFGYAFNNCTSLKKIPQFNTANANAVSNMFYGCRKVESGALSIYRQLSTQAYQPNHDDTFTDCGIDTATGLAELEQIHTSWGGLKTDPDLVDSDGDELVDSDGDDLVALDY